MIRFSPGNPFALFTLAWSALLLAGCPGPTSPPTRFFLLASLEAKENAIPRTPEGLTVELEPVEIPQYLNRPEIVTRASGNRIKLERMNQWAGDFKEDLGRVSMENLSRLLHSDRVIILPNKSEHASQFRLATIINRFEPDEAGQVWLDARWNLFDGRGRLLVTRHSDITVRAEQPEEYESLTGAMSRALGQLNREMADAILAQSQADRTGARP
ncbi:MAG: membrane integrity-associated transporter subunit PqiC [Magnetococcales bacterium]|nr:membrane integrity-associated transporter subunit PqiC [Magnetococcales bacterium]